MKSNNLTFDEYKYKSRSILSQSESPAMIRSLLKSGLVKSEKQAFGLMITMIIVFLASAGFIFYTNFFKQPVVPPMTSEQETFYKQQMNASTKSNSK